MTTLRTLAVAGALLGLLPGLAAAQETEPTVEPTARAAFEGVPYAAPPRSAGASDFYGRSLLRTDLAGRVPLPRPASR